VTFIRAQGVRLLLFREGSFFYLKQKFPKGFREGVVVDLRVVAV